MQNKKSAKNPMENNNKVMIEKESNEPYVCLYCVACLDIMGVTRELSPFSNNEFILKHEKQAEFNAVLGPLVKFIQTCRICFSSFIEDSNYKINVSFFSDSFIAGIPFGEELYSSNDHSPIIKGISYLLKT